MAPRGTGASVREGLALSLSIFTIAPVRAAVVNRRTAEVAMSLAPLVGALLGALIAGLALLLRLAHPPAVLIGALCVAAGAMLTRVLHLDGLADTVDALGSYRDRERALAIMKSPEVGPFGVVAIVLALLVPAAAWSGLVGLRWWVLVCAAAASFGVGRLAVTWACRRGIPAARPEGLGALVAGTVRVPGLIVATTLVAALAIPADINRPWHGPLAVAVALLASIVVMWHCVRRFGGVTGDVLGACVEVAATIAFVAMAL